MRADDRAGRHVDVPVAQRRFDFVDADLPRGERVRIELRVHRVLLAAENLHLRDARDLRDPLRDARLGVLVERPRRQRRRRDDQIEDRLIGRVDLREHRRRRHALRQQARRLRDRALHVDRRAVEAAVERELERDLRRAERVDRRHLLEAGDRRELILERRRDRRAHRLRTGARQLRGDEQRRKVDVRQVADRQRRYATMPNSAIAAISRLVAIGRLMNPSEMFMDLGGQSLPRIAPKADRSPLVVRPLETCPRSRRLYARSLAQCVRWHRPTPPESCASSPTSP